MATYSIAVLYKFMNFTISDLTISTQTHLPIKLFLYIPGASVKISMGDAISERDIL